MQGKGIPSPTLSYHKDTQEMAQHKDRNRMTQIIALRSLGKSDTEIAQEIGVTRQTINNYLRSPELQQMVAGTQADLVKLLNKAINVAMQAMDTGDKGGLLVANSILQHIGSKVMAQTSTISATRELTPVKDRKALEDKLINLLSSAPSTISSADGAMSSTTSDDKSLST